MAIRLWLVMAAAAALLLPGCTTGRDIPQTFGHRSGWSDENRAVAAETYSYALMANNAYAGGHVDLGPDLRRLPSPGAGPCGFAYELFERLEGGRRVEVIIAFRGTDFKELGDWICGNILGRQNRWGLALYDEWRRRIPDVPITVTGHSLGGGIATHVSLNRDDVTSYAFNSSPRFWVRDRASDNRRISVVERGEINKVLRIFGREATQLYVSLPCSRGNPVAQHAMIRLAACLTQIAAIGCRQAAEALARNPRLARREGPWPAEEADQPGTRCIHLPVTDRHAHPVTLVGVGTGAD